MFLSFELRHGKIAVLIALVVLLGGQLLTPVEAQVAGATLSGTVTDPSGSVVPNAQMVIKNVATGVSRSVTTNGAGFYTAPNLLPGAYAVTVTASGFKTEVRSGITLNVGEEQVLNVTLQVGQMSQTVEVSTEAPIVELASSSISAVVSSTTVRELPLNGRSWTDLATLQPGVNAIQTQAAVGFSSARGNRGFGDQITVAGARPQQNNYRLDGISVNDYANGAPGSVLGGDLGVDAIAEFSVLTSNYSSEYGRTSGGVVNAITRSGSNQFHGGVYEFIRNSALDAPGYFDAGKVPPFRRNQFGAEAGGPIRKDKLFVFGDYEGIRQSKGTTKVDPVPSLAARGIAPGGTMPTQVAIVCIPQTTGPCMEGPLPPESPCPPFTCVSDPTTHIDVAAEKYLPFWPFPNRGTNGDIGIFTFPQQQVVTENFGTARVDGKISEKDSFHATYLGDITPTTLPSDLDAVLIDTNTNRQIGTVEETHIFSTSLVNSVRVGYSRDAVVDFKGVSAINPLAADPSLASITSIPGFNATQVLMGLAPFIGGVGSASAQLYTWNSFQEYDDASWTHGTHSIKFGGGVERMQLNTVHTQDPGGIFNFGDLYLFLTNQPQRFSAFLTPPNIRGTRQTLVGLYLQDDWRVRPNLTINLGIRWEMVTVPTEVKGKLSNLLQITDPLTALHVGSPLYSNSTKRDFDPRVGFAWDPFHNGKTAVRGGFGIFDNLPLPYLFVRAGGFPFEIYGNANSLMPGTFYTGATAGLASPKHANVNFIEQKPHRSYTMQWNLTVQRELVPNLTAVVGYAGSAGEHLPIGSDDSDIAFPAKTSLGYLFPSSGTTINPNFGQISSEFFAAHSSYHALEAAVQKRMSHGLQFQGSFTWSRSIDNSSATTYGNQFTNSISSLPWYDLNSVRGLSDFNIGRTLVINANWQVPSPKSLSGPAAWITSGWELGAIYKASDGVPFTATYGTNGDPQGLGSNDPWAFPNRLTGSGCQSLINPGNPNNYIRTQCFAIPTAPMSFSAQCLNATGAATPPPAGQVYCINLRGNAGRNILIGPGTSNLDFSVFKNNYIRRISENFNIQFRAELFNILNRNNFAVPVTPDNTDIFDTTGAATGVTGLLLSLNTDPREIQFALKVSW